VFLVLPLPRVSLLLILVVASLDEEERVVPLASCVVFARTLSHPRFQRLPCNVRHVTRTRALLPSGSKTDVTSLHYNASLDEEQQLVHLASCVVFARALSHAQFQRIQCKERHESRRSFFTSHQVNKESSTYFCIQDRCYLSTWHGASGRTAMDGFISRVGL
jgi:hypothetical protein